MGIRGKQLSLAGHRVRVARLVLTLLAIPSLLPATIVTFYSAGKLLLDTQRVIVGKAMEIEGEGHEFRLKVRLLRVLQGPGSPGDELCARLPVFTGLGNRPMPYQKKRLDGTVLMFLRDAPGCLTALPRNSYAGQLEDFTFDAETAPPPVPDELTQGQTILQLAAEFLAAMPRLIADKSPPTGSFRVASDPTYYRSTTADRRAASAFDDVAAILKEQGNLEPWVAWIASPQVQAPLELQAALQVVNSDPAGLRVLLGIIEVRQPTWFMITAIHCIEFHYRSPDPEGVHLLGRLAKGPALYARSSAVEALARIHTKEAVPYLLEAIEGPENSAWAAVFGLEKYAGGEFKGSEDRLRHRGVFVERVTGTVEPASLEERRSRSGSEYKRNPQAVIQYWKDWGRRHAFIQ